MSRSGRLLWLGGILLGLAITGCTPTYAGRLRTRDPLEGKLEAYRSGTIVLGIADVDVTTPMGQKPELLQSAWFEVMSPNEIWFHVKLSHKWQELANISEYDVRLVTSRGDRLVPTRVWLRGATVETQERTLAQIKPPVVQGGVPTVTTETERLDLHGGDNIVVFKCPGIVSPQVRSYTLYLRSTKRRLSFTWDLVPGAEIEDEE